MILENHDIHSDPEGRSQTVLTAEPLYGIYALVRVGTGLPKVLLLTIDEDWTQSPEPAGRWGSRAAVEGILLKMAPQENFKNVWWFTWSRAAALDQAGEPLESTKR